MPKAATGILFGQIFVVLGVALGVGLVVGWVPRGLRSPQLSVAGHLDALLMRQYTACAVSTPTTFTVILKSYNRMRYFQ